MRFLLLIVILSFTSPLISAMEKQQDNFFEAGTNAGQKLAILCEECGEGVFSGSTQINGRPVFFGMERIDTDLDKKNWLKYQHYALEVEQLYQYLSESIKEGKQIGLNDETWDDHTIEYLTGFSQEDDLQQYVVSFKEFMKDEKSLKIATGISRGASSFGIAIRIGCYVIYASKERVSGKYSFPEDFGSISPLQALEKHFKDLIMTVCSRDYREDERKEITSFEDRGIFCNPVNRFHDGSKYSGVSLKLHGLRACAQEYFYPNSSEKYMYVGSAFGMTKALVSFGKWERGDFLLNGKDFVDCSEAERKPKPGDTPCWVKISALIKIFQQ